MRSSGLTKVLCACALGSLTLCTTAEAAPTEAYVTSYASSGAVKKFATGSGGELATDGSAGTGAADPWYEAITPNGRYLYVTNNDQAGTVAQFSIGPGGALTALSPATVSAGLYPTGLAVSPDGEHLYVAEYHSGAVAIFDVASDGTLTPNASQATETENLDGPYGVAVSPDGKSLYVPNRGYGSPGGGTLAEFDVASDGTLTPKATPTVPATNGPTNGPDYVAITPNGKFAYATDYLNSGVFQYTVGAGGELSPNGAPAAAAIDADLSATVSPDGNSLYVPAESAIYQFSIGSTGLLSAKFPRSIPSGPGARSLWFTADGTSAYSANDISATDGTVAEWDVAAGGTLSAKSTPTVTSVPGASAVMIAPEQGPLASFTGTPAAVDAQSHFDGSSSEDPDGTIDRYAWSFGDGASDPNGGQTSAHTYARPGRYSVTLTVTDDSGCSTSFVFTGVTAYCNGGPAAQQGQTITIPAIRPTASTGQAANLTRRGAKLHGLVNPRGASTTYYFQYGSSTHYGHLTPATSAGAGITGETVSAALSGLTPGRTYYYRLVATNRAGTAMGAQRKFKTAAAG
jgi:6-phosphogluconolactonase (cycloisomerase 2 family)